MIEAIRSTPRRGPVVLATSTDDTSLAAAVFARRVANRAGVALRVAATPSESVRVARVFGATVVVVPAPPHRRVSRGVSGEIAPWVVARSGCPVASVSPELDHLPRTCVAAVDFSDASIRAVQSALLMLDDCGKLLLVYVAPLRNLSRPRHAESGAILRADIDGLFERLQVELRAYAPLGAAIEAQVETGEMIDEVLSVAREVEADLIAVGVRSRVTDRLFDFGSATRLLDRATCTVVASPAHRSSHAIWPDGWHPQWISSPDWFELGKRLRRPRALGSLR